MADLLQEFPPEFLASQTPTPLHCLDFHDRGSFDASAGLAKAMKRCPYCGKQYADDADICPVDRQTLVDPAVTPRKTGEAGARGTAAFNARLVSHSVAVGTYRVYLRGQDLVFVQADKEKVNRGVDFIGLLGPAGDLVAVAARLWQKRKAATAPAHDDNGGPEDSHHQDENSFSIYLGEVRDAALEPPGHFALSGKQAGRLELLVGYGRTVKLELPTADDVKSVLNLLAPLLKSTLRIKVEWDEGARRFRKKQKVKAIGSNP